MVDQPSKNPLQMDPCWGPTMGDTCFSDGGWDFFSYTKLYEQAATNMKVKKK